MRFGKNTVKIGVLTLDPIPLSLLQDERCYTTRSLLGDLKEGFKRVPTTAASGWSKWNRFTSGIGVDPYLTDYHRLDKVDTRSRFRCLYPECRPHWIRVLPILLHVSAGWFRNWR